jgi:hydroxymethylbilane synthase
VLLHAVGQGALGLEIRSGDVPVRELLRRMGHWQTEWACGAERGLLRILEGGCSVPVGIETAIEEIGDGESGSERPGYAEGILSDLDGSSPLIHFSGILPVNIPLPSPSASADAVRSMLQPRRARIRILASVTSLDGSNHVLHDAPEAMVTSWRGAEKWGEECARKLKDLGAGEVLDDINKLRKAREDADLQKAKEASMPVGETMAQLAA